MKIKMYCYSVLLTFISNFLVAQEISNLKENNLTGLITEYYKMDRENIHLHLNKSIYLTEEDIWFKGYVIEKKNKLPFAKTSNVYLKLLDNKGTEILSKLYFCENSTFEGNIKLDSKLSSGTYFLQTYTNYMNNFLENESNFSKIEIINTNDDNYVSTKKINFNAINISFYVEGETLLEGVKNVLTAKIEDCNGNGIIVNNAEILDEANNFISSFSTDQFGFGKFEINNTQNKQYKLLFVLNEKNIEKNLPNVLLKGYTLSVNNFSSIGKTIIKIGTNKRTLADNKNLNLNLLIQQNDVFLETKIAFKENKTEETLVISNDQIPSGINSVYIIDESLKKYNERVFLKPETSLIPTSFNVAQKRNNKIEINGISSLINGEVSISVLPLESLSDNFENNIQSAHVFNNYLENNIKNPNYFLQNITKSKHAQLDNQLIASKTKYSFEKIVTQKNKNDFEFDEGLVIKGTINDKIDYKNDKVKMTSIVYGINEETSINEKNEYIFKNVIAVDSSFIHFSLIDKKGNQIKLKQYGQIINNNKKFLKPFFRENQPCAVNNFKTENLKYPKLKKAVYLDSVNISNKLTKKKLVNNNRYGNANSRGFKINDEIANSYIDIFSFLQFNGFNINREGGSVRISNRNRISIMGSNNPDLFLDDSPTDADFLTTLNMKDIDEIFINKNTGRGFIRIYSKKIKTGNSYFKTNSQSLLVKNGFQPYKNFTNPKYENINTEGFQNFGTIHWEPKIKTDDRGVFQFSIPDMNLKAVKIIIEGISSDGQIISETKILEIK